MTDFNDLRCPECNSLNVRIILNKENEYLCAVCNCNFTVKELNLLTEEETEELMPKTKNQRNPAFHSLLERIADLHDSKNHDYGEDGDALSNLRGCSRMGLHPTQGIAVRLQDKMSRIETFFSKGKLKNESLKDSFLDMAIYSLLAIVILEEGEDEN